MSPCGFGAFAEYVRAPQGALALKPPALTFQQAAAVPQAGGLALLSLRGRRPIQPGHQVLINGAGGGVGTFAMQIATAHGAEVTGVDRREAGHGPRCWRRSRHRLHHRRLHPEPASLRPDRRSCRAPAYVCLPDCHTPGGACAIIGGSIPRVLVALALGPGLSLLGSKKVGVSPVAAEQHAGRGLPDPAAASRVRSTGRGQGLPAQRGRCGVPPLRRPAAHRQDRHHHLTWPPQAGTKCAEVRAADACLHCPWDAGRSLLAAPPGVTLDPWWPASPA
jgi:hypothetical protein